MRILTARSKYITTFEFFKGAEKYATWCILRFAKIKLKYVWKKWEKQGVLLQ